MYNNISGRPNFPNIFVAEEISKNLPSSVTERHDDSVSTSNPPIRSTEEVLSAIREGKQKDTNNPSSSQVLRKKTTSPSPLQVEYLKQNSAFDGESSDRHLLRQSSLPSDRESSGRHPWQHFASQFDGENFDRHLLRQSSLPFDRESSDRHPWQHFASQFDGENSDRNLLQNFASQFEGENSDRNLLQKSSSQNANNGRGVNGDTTIVHIDDVHRATPPIPSPSSRRTPSPMGLLGSITPPSWLTKSSALRKTGVILGETINHATIAALVWGTISPLINRANGSNSVDSSDYKGMLQIASLNVCAMAPISFVLSNTLFPILRGIMGYEIEKAELDEAFSEPGFVARFKSAQKDTDYNAAIADVLYSCGFGAGMAAASQIPAWAKAAGLSENNQQIVNSAIQMAIAAGALALVRTSVMLSRTVDGQPAYQIKSLGHHNPIKNLGGQFKAITQTKRKDEPDNISPNYRALRNLVLRMLEEVSVWGGTTLYSVPTGLMVAADKVNANTPTSQFLSGYLTVTLGYFFDSGNSLNEPRINEDFSPWKFLGVLGATKEFFLPDLPSPTATMRALDESASLATVAQSIVKDIGNIGQRVLNAKNVFTTYGPRIFLEIATSVEHELVKIQAHYGQYCTNQNSSVQIEELDSSVTPLTRSPSVLPGAGNEEDISHIVEITPADTHDNPAPPIEEIELSKVAQAQNPSVPLGAGNEEAISHIVEVAPDDVNDEVELATQQQKAADLEIVVTRAGQN